MTTTTSQTSSTGVARSMMGWANVLNGTLIIALLSCQAIAQSPPSDFRQHELTRLLLQDCTQCHGMRLTGDSAPPLTGQALAGKPNAQLVDIILRGQHRSPMPAWASKLSEAEAEWIVQRLREGALDVR